MKMQSVAALAVILLAFCVVWAQDRTGTAASTRPSADQTEQTSEEVSSYRWILRHQPSGEQLGTRQLVCTKMRSQSEEDEPASEHLRIRETTTLTHRGHEAGWDSVVVYDLSGQAPRAVEAKATTSMDGRTVMQAELKFDGSGQCTVTVELSETAEADSQQAPTESTKSTSTGRWRNPEEPKPLLFASSAEVLAPLFLGDANLLENVVVAEFPDDIDEPVTFKDGFTVQREVTQQEGHYQIRVLSLSDPHYWAGDYNEKDLCVRITSGNLVQLPPEATTQPSPNASRKSEPEQ